MGKVPSGFNLLTLFTDVYYDYLETEILSKSRYRKHHILLVRAPMAYFIRHATGIQNMSEKL